MIEKINEIFKNYDFGYDLILISSDDDWERQGNTFSKKIYLEQTNKFISPLSGVFFVMINDNGGIYTTFEIFDSK